MKRKQSDNTNIIYKSNGKQSIFVHNHPFVYLIAYLTNCKQTIENFQQKIQIFCIRINRFFMLCSLLHACDFNHTERIVCHESYILVRKIYILWCLLINLYIIFFSGSNWFESNNNLSFPGENPFDCYAILHLLFSLNCWINISYQKYFFAFNIRFMRLIRKCYDEKVLTNAIDIIRKLSKFN